MKKVRPILTSLFFTLIILLVHVTRGISTMVNGGGFGISNFSLTEIVNLHRTHPVFIRRKVTTLLIDFCSNIFSINIGSAFVLVNFTLLFFSGILIFYLSRRFTNNYILNMYSLYAYYLCFPIFFMFFPPVYSYDEPLQFCLILFSLICYYRDNYLIFAIVFGTSLIVRESGVILLPALFFVFVYNWGESLYQNIKSKEFWVRSLSIVMSLIIYLFYLLFFIKTNASNQASKEYFLQRFSYIKWNFQSAIYSIESIGGFLLIFLVPLSFLFINRFQKSQLTVKNKKMLYAFFITLLINTLVVYMNTKSREVRLFLMPLFFLWPIFGTLFYENFKLIFKMFSFKSLFLSGRRSIFFVIAFLINAVLSFGIYRTTIGPRVGVFNLYLFFSFSVVILFYFFLVEKSIKANTK